MSVFQWFRDAAQAFEEGRHDFNEKHPEPAWVPAPETTPSGTRSSKAHPNWAELNKPTVNLGSSHVLRSGFDSGGMPVAFIQDLRTGERIAEAEGSKRPNLNPRGFGQACARFFGSGGR